jgi:hypothetical protein
MSESSNYERINKLVLPVWISIFGPRHGREWHAAGLTWQQAEAKQREYFVATFGAKHGNYFADQRLPTAAAFLCARVAREANARINAAELKAHEAQVALLKRMNRDARAADETARMN